MALIRSSRRRPTSTQSAARSCKHWQLVRLEDRLTPALLYPNLQVLQSYLPSGNVTVNGSNEIRFSTALANAGQGPFDLRANGQVVNNPDGTQDILTNQRVYDDVNANGKYDLGVDTAFVDQFAGYFSYHAAHSHMHFNDFAIARLRVRPADQSLGPVIAVGPKTSFCLIDINHFSPTLPGSPASAQYSCDASHEGISVGWADVYGSGLEGQFINVTNVPNGDYWLEVEADYVNHIQETIETDNVTRSPITIGNQPATIGLQVLSSTPLGGQQSPVSFVEFDFNQLVDPSTFTASAITFTGPGGNIPVTVEQIDGAHYRANFATQSAIGTYSMTLAPTVKTPGPSAKFLDQNGNGTGGETGDSYNNIFAIAAPNIASVTPAGTAAAPVSTVRVTYNRLMNSSTFTTADIISFTNPTGVDLLGTITGVTAVTAGGQSTAFDIAFTPVSGAGPYTMVLGANVADTNGNLVDQNNNGTPNEVADRYTNVFAVPASGTYGPDAFGYTAVSHPYQPITLTGATGISYTNTDDESKAMNIGTDTFNFYGKTYTGSTIYVSTNTLITFGAGSTSYDNNAGLASLTSPTIAALWDDWIIGSGNPQVQYLRRDTNGDSINDQLVVEWNKIRHYGTTSGDITVQAILELNTGNRPGKIIINYPDLDQGSSTYNNGAAASVGLRSPSSPNTSLTVSANSNTHPLVGSNKAMLISVPTVTSITRLDASPAPDGDVEFEVTFSEGVTSVDPADFSLTFTGTLHEPAVVGVMPTANANVWHVIVDSHTGTGSLRLNVVDNDSIISLAGSKLGGAGLVNGDFNTGEAYDIFQRAPQVVHVAIQNDSAQRSRIDQITVTFDHPVEFAAAPDLAFKIIGPLGQISIAEVNTMLGTPEQTVAKLTFTGTGTEFGSLADGAYTLTLVASQINTEGVLFDGNNDGTGGDNYVMNFHRLFGDVNGDRTVSNSDFNAFRNAFGGTEMAFDFNNDGAVAGSDFNAFKENFGASV